MPRPCHASHPLSPETCPACKWCILDGQQARDYRTLWGEPEPGVLGIPNTSRCPFLSSRARNEDGTVDLWPCREDAAVAVLCGEDAWLDAAWEV